MRNYLVQTKTLSFSVVAIAPLIFLYEYYIAQVNANQLLEVRNAAEIFIKHLLSYAGISSPPAYTLLYCSLLLAAFVYARKQNIDYPKISYWFGFLIECSLYAVVFGIVARTITDLLLALQITADMEASMWSQYLLALAAGIYEELLFRLFVVGSLLLLFRSLLPTHNALQIVLASFISATIFSLFHYPTIDTIELNSFLFRFVAGFILSLLFVFRGLAVTVYTHAFYDVFFIYRAM